MREFAVPEILLTPLENIVLKAKEFKMHKPHVILGLAMDPPKLADIATTILILKELGALLLEVRDEGYVDIDGDLTFLGKMMSSLPLDVRATRLIAIGYCFGLLEECVIMGTSSFYNGSFISSNTPPPPPPPNWRLTFSTHSLVSLLVQINNSRLPSIAQHFRNVIRS